MKIKLPIAAIALATAVSMSGLLDLSVANAAEVSELKFNTTMVKPVEGQAIPDPNLNLAVTAEGGITIDDTEELFGAWYEKDPMGICRLTNDAQFMQGKQYLYRFAIGKFSLPAGDTLKNNAKVLLNGEEYSLAGCADAGIAPSGTSFVAYGPITIPTPPTAPQNPPASGNNGGGTAPSPSNPSNGNAPQNNGVNAAANSQSTKRSLADTGSSLYLIVGGIITAIAGGAATLYLTRR